MRWMGGVAALVLLAGTCPAQMPDRDVLTRKIQLEEDELPSFRTLTEAELRAEIQIRSARSHAVFGYNTPEVQILLPKTSNSHYVDVEFSEATLLNAAGRKVPYELERGVYDSAKYSDEIRFRHANSEQVVSYARARGSVKVKYPIAVSTLKLTPAEAGPEELALQIDGPYVSFADGALDIPDTAGFSKLMAIRAYDAEGIRLERHGYSETSTDDDGIYRRKLAFWGNVARLEIDAVDHWVEIEVPYDLEPAPLLPAGREGLAPESE